MKTLTLLFSLFILSSPLSLSAQSASGLLRKVSEALSAGRDDYAVSLFRQAADADASQTEMFYWTSVDKNSAVVSLLANELATHYKEERNYDKAYLFYKELLQRHPEDVSALVSCAEMELMRGKEKEALRLYEKVLLLDGDNLQANIYLGNYYYLQAEKDRKKLDDDYRKLSSPTRMQYARYRNGLSDLVINNYAKAKAYLQRVLQLFPSTEAGNTLKKIRKIEAEAR
ncbi:tetratricopeptide repeat protein [Bacteroides zoogleoformans]|uniref:tetratricopeptide repeat protein n=1 Tax=Bacteroides zoogleoformans TaxID=28119 RepID=UPI00248D5FC2|nr:tetratricopeptide repeat protein [Bacteroides zoogleoformans]